ncbi:DUF4430 domain-containing protein [Evansella sp. AB-P1]|uniref:DUF4430 domain-containing protein n=1 Tax=Evansella sp. AB-P1 TaxID=3037653 RepID=UPI00241CC921|nr:DUF4430 domain-containing protein [Evansella sp. AB-P1]MDG5789828.1 DUF4430 domain-containing protein [Evansella sp. AB-P1]
MKGRIFNGITVLFSILLILSLLGCGTGNNSVSLGNENNVSNEVEEAFDNDQSSEEEENDSDVLSNENEEKEEGADTDASPSDDTVSEVKEEKGEVSPPSSSQKEAEKEKNPPSSISNENKNKIDTSSNNNSSAKEETTKEKQSTSSSSSEQTKEKDNTKDNKESRDTSKTETKEETKTPDPTVTIVVKGPKEVGTIINRSTVTISDGDTVLDVLLNVAGQQNPSIHVDYSGRGAMAYVHGIDNYYELDYGPRSGWIGKINGNDLTKSAGATSVKDGDHVEWLYMEDFMGDS